MNKHRYRFAPLAMSFILVATLASPGQAAPQSDASPDRSFSDSEAVSSDLRVTADSLEMSVAEAELLFAGQDEFNVLLNEIAHTEQGNYSSAIWRTDTRPTPTISFVNMPSAATVAKVEALPFEVLVETGAPLDMEGWDVAVEEAFRDVVAEPNVSDATAYVDAETETVHVEYQAATSETGEAELPSRAQLRERVLQRIDRLKGVGYAVEQVKSAGADSEVVRGGKAFGGCTTGFAVFQNGTRGLVTAGHCSDATNTPSGSSYGAPFRGQHEGSYGDMQWHSTVDSTLNQVALNSGTLTRTISGQAIGVVGGSVCNYGKTRTSYNCTTIRNASACATITTNGVGKYICRLVITGGTFTNGGDSGGPWFFGNYAYGIHTAANDTTGLMYYTRIGNVEAILGVTTKIT